jgi:hypothetical protein
MKRAFRRAVAEELISPLVYKKIQAVAALYGPAKL